MNRLIDKLALKNNDWINIVKSFGADEHTAKDVVQNMYIKLHEWEERGNNSILYNKDEVNYYFVFKVLRSVWIDLLRKNKKYIPTDNKKIFVKSNEQEQSEVDFTIGLKEKLEKMHWYDKRVFDIVCIQGISMLQLSELTGISYYSIKRTIKKVKKHLK